MKGKSRFLRAVFALVICFAFAQSVLAEDCEYYVVPDPGCGPGGLHAWSMCQSVNEEGGYLEIHVYDDGCSYVVTP